MEWADSDLSLVNNDDEDSSPYPGNASELPPIDDEEIRQVEAAFSNMIDLTCSDGAEADGNIFEHTYIPQDWYAHLFRSIVPSQDTLKQQPEQDLPRQFFSFEGKEGVKYAFKVLDRRTNSLTYEQMPTYHRYGMRLLFSGPIQRELLHTNAIKNIIARQTNCIGKAFDDPKSRKHIPSFVKMYKINMNELLQTNISDYATFNEFFYRKLKPSARKIADSNNPNVIVSAADCRLIIFDNVNDATRLWIKGHNFSLKHLFRDEKLAEEFNGGSIAIFRLAPVDYHRFHSPVDGEIGTQMKKITDVLTRNQRTVITIESQLFEKTAFVAIGALLVGSVNFTVEPKQQINKGDELGYFAYGGSTIVVAFKAGMIKWDDDLRHNSDNSMETLVRMGEQIGQRRTDEERQEYLSNVSNNGAKNATITQLVTCFPAMSMTK
ncbi:unnamed protein product [Rotaria magnacalcarata]